VSLDSSMNLISDPRSTNGMTNRAFTWTEMQPRKW